MSTHLSPQKPAYQNSKQVLLSLEAQAHDVISCLRDEEDYLRRTAKSLRRRLLLEYESEVQNAEPDVFLYCPDRWLDPCDFNHWFVHRNRIANDQQRELIEAIACKIVYKRKDGRDGYFRQLERNVGWTQHILPIVIAHPKAALWMVRCGMDRNKFCHQTDLCAQCLWNDQLRVNVAAFGEKSITFDKANVWWFTTCGFTTNQNNSKWIGDEVTDETFKYVPGEHDYDPFPVLLCEAKTGFNDNYRDASILSLILHQAARSALRLNLADGIRSKIEHAFQIWPEGVNRCNTHSHAVANGDEDNMEFIAETLFERLRRGLIEFNHLLTREYYPDVKVSRMQCAKDLERLLKYTEKVVSVGSIVRDAMARPEAKLNDGGLNPAYMAKLKNSLLQLLQDDIPSIYQSIVDVTGKHSISRRVITGNMRFGANCIGNEPIWHAEKRRRHAAWTAQRRKEAKEQANKRLKQS